MVTYRPRKRSSTDAKRKTPLPNEHLLIEFDRGFYTTYKTGSNSRPGLAYNAPEANISNAVVCLFTAVESVKL